MKLLGFIKKQIDEMGVADTIWFILGLILIASIIIWLPFFVKDNSKEIIGNAFYLGKELLFILAFLGIIVLVYRFFDKRHKKCIICRDKKKGRKVHSWEYGYYHLECAKQLEKTTEEFL